MRKQTHSDSNEGNITDTPNITETCSHDNTSNVDFDNTFCNSECNF
jgi:hypothetical protein